MLSPYRINPNKTKKRTKKTSSTNFNNDLHQDPELKRHQTTSITSNANVKSSKNKKKNIVKAGTIHDNVESNEPYLDEIVHINYL